MADLSLEQFCAQVNLLARERVEQLNREYREGKRLFGARHHDFPEDMLKLYFERGMTPSQALDAIYAEGGA